MCPQVRGLEVVVVLRDEAQRTDQETPDPGLPPNEALHHLFSYVGRDLEELLPLHRLLGLKEGDPRQRSLVYAERLEVAVEVDVAGGHDEVIESPKLDAALDELEQDAVEVKLFDHVAAFLDHVLHVAVEEERFVEQEGLGVCVLGNCLFQ